MSLRDLADRAGISFLYIVKLETDAIGQPGEEIIINNPKLVNVSRKMIIIEKYNNKKEIRYVTMCNMSNLFFKILYKLIFLI